MRTETDKTKLYDRQLRLWQKDGQAALERARVVVVGSSTLASESLKNLVLPGVGEFIVVDDALVADEDLRTNFFVRAADAGKSRAQSIVDNLCEMNPDVHGQALVKAPAEFIALSEQDGPEAELLGSATLVIVCAQPDEIVRALGARCWDANIPMVAACNAGFIAEIRTAVREHTIVESHAGAKSDLRVMAPFAELRAYADSIDLEALDSTDLAHVPFVVLLIKAVDKWVAETGLAKTGLEYKHRKEIAKLVSRMAPAPGEENFDEAAAAVNANCSDYEVPSEVSQILADPAANAATAQTSSFWLLANALRRYLGSEYAEGKLPHSGAIPDMKADTQSYIKLQRIYKQKAEQDKAELVRCLCDVLQEAGLPAEHVSSDEVDMFCKNAGRLRLVRTQPVHHDAETAPAIWGNLADEGVSAHYALFRAVNTFLAKNGRYPGMPGVDVSDLDALCVQDTSELQGIAAELMRAWGDKDPETPRNLAAEFVRSGCMELHNVSAIVGGVVAQETIKLITHQYVPHDGVCILDTANTTLAAVKA
ncbi:hypothetical protein H4S02_002233 [Coemansia sp. RSA 2611]|nr:hypothetical protein H4S02_002233 [Coemansia sp. RSA 2611]